MSKMLKIYLIVAILGYSCCFITGCGNACRNFQKCLCEDFAGVVTDKDKDHRTSSISISVGGEIPKTFFIDENLWHSALLGDSIRKRKGSHTCFIKSNGEWKQYSFNCNQPEDSLYCSRIPEYCQCE